MRDSGMENGVVLLDGVILASSVFVSPSGYKYQKAR